VALEAFAAVQGDTAAKQEIDVLALQDGKRGIGRRFGCKEHIVEGSAFPSAQQEKAKLGSRFENRGQTAFMTGKADCRGFSIRVCHARWGSRDDAKYIVLLLRVTAGVYFSNFMVAAYFDPFTL
jgi:hypothetical protein